MNRAPAPAKSFVRGKSGYVPFWPGGLEDVLLGSEDNLTEGGKGLRTIPPGFSRGLRLLGDHCDDDETFAGIEEISDQKKGEIIEEVHLTNPSSSISDVSRVQDVYSRDEDDIGAVQTSTNTLEIDELLPTTVRR